MRRSRKLKIIYLICFIFAAGLIVGLILYALRQNINLFYTPSELTQANLPATVQIRLGGMVKAGSIKYADNSELQVSFIVTDFNLELPVVYKGVLPDLFKEGQGVVALGKFKANVFYANQILAKHDENYMPPELNDLAAKPRVTNVS